MEQHQSSLDCFAALGVPSLVKTRKVRDLRPLLQTWLGLPGQIQSLTAASLTVSETAAFEFRFRPAGFECKALRGGSLLQ